MYYNTVMSNKVKAENNPQKLSPSESRLLEKLLKIFIGAFVVALILRMFPMGNLELPIYKKVKIGGNEIKAEVAVSDEKRAKGLSGRKELPKESGMLFVFENPEIHPFWMKDMLIPLDLVFIDQNYNVVDLRKNLPPCSDVVCDKIIPVTNVKYAIELNAGWLDEKGVKVGDKIEVIK